jgi:nucleotide-binding universal stress UspA family protein
MMSKNNANRTVLIAAIDRTPASDPAVTTAAGLARGITGAELHLPHVLAPLPEAVLPAIPSPSTILEEGRKFIDGVARAAAERFEGRIAAHLAVGEPAREILQLASDLDADVIVVGSHGKKALERMLVGSVSLSVVKKALCPVVVARPKEYVHEEVPEILPPCPKCLDTQRASKGAKLWCEQHAGRHVHGHLHYEMPKGFGQGSMLIRPEQ